MMASGLALETGAAAVEPAADGIDALVRSLRAELALLGELGAQLVDQRAALAADDTAALELMLQQIGRTLLTIREARRQRNVLIELMTGRQATSLLEMADLVGAGDEPSFRDLCRQLHLAAVAAGRELAVNQLAIRRAIEAGERFLHTLLTVPSDAGQPGERPSGLILNERA